MCSLSLLSLPVLPSSITDTTIYSNQHSKSGTCYISFISTNPKLPVSHVTYIFNNSFSILLTMTWGPTHSVTTSDLFTSSAVLLCCSNHSGLFSHQAAKLCWFKTFTLLASVSEMPVLWFFFWWAHFHSSGLISVSDKPI